MKKMHKTPLSLAMGTAVLTGFAMNVQAETNPFALTDLANGYMVAEAAKTNSQGACGGNVSDANGKKIGQSGAKAKSTEGSCGEGMCGGMMQGGKMKKGMEGVCGEMMKGKEGACGMMGGMSGMNHGDNGKSTEASCGAMMKGGEGSCGSMMKGGEGSCGAKSSDK